MPERVTVAGEFVALLTNETEPEMAPLVLGVYVSVTCLLAPALMVRGRLNPVTLKSDPTTLAADTVTEPVPLFVKVVVFVVLFPITTLPNARLVGDALNRKVGVAVAVPERDTTGGVFGALLVIVSVPVKLPVVVGANFTVRFVA